MLLQAEGCEAQQQQQGKHVFKKKKLSALEPQQQRTTVAALVDTGGSISLREQPQPQDKKVPQKSLLSFSMDEEG